MGGEYVPYHLRPNKYVERELFLELLSYISRVKSLESYVYISMGGRFLEDFKRVHIRHGITKMISIEENEVIFQRQKFNLPVSYIQLLRTNTSAFIANFDNHTKAYADSKFVIWLDYADANKRQEQLSEYQSLISKVAPYDIIKITLNANPTTLKDPYRNLAQTELNKKALGKLAKQLGEYYQSHLGIETLTRENMPSILSESIRYASLTGLGGSADYTIMPLSICCYTDTHPMITATSIIIDCEVKEFVKRTNINEWPFFSKNWQDVKKINIPDLSVKERMHIDSIVFNDDLKSVHSNLPFRLAEKEKDSIKELEMYRTHYRRYPHYVNVSM